MEPNDLVGEIGVKAHTRRTGNRDIGPETHEEGCQGGNCGCSGDEIPLDDPDAKEVVLVFSADWVSRRRVTDTGSPGL